MLKQERHQQILKELAEKRKVLSVDLSKILQVSEDTIRRDLNELNDKHLLHKVHGGALPLENTILSYNQRSNTEIAKKGHIAKKALELIHNGQVILMSGSTINLELAKIIPSNIKATIFTYSLPIALELTKHPLIEVIFLGGKLNKSAQVTVGIDVINAISSIKADICFMGVGGINVNRGMTEQDWEVAHIKKHMINNSDYTVAMCLNERIKSNRSFTIVPIEQIDCIITDLDEKDTKLKGFKDKGVVVI